MNFNEQQLEAINQRNNNILVAAAAGSGKTAVLTTRIINRLKEGIDIDHLLVITFTNAAASEMRERIEKGILDEIRSGNHSLKPQLDKIYEANICTFDAYYLKLIKKYGYILEIDSDIKIGDSIDFEIKEKKYLKQILNEAIGNPLLNDLLNNYGNSDVKNVETLILDIYNSTKKFHKIIPQEKFYNQEIISKNKIAFKNIILDKTNELKNILKKLRKISSCDKGNEVISEIINSMDFIYREEYNDIYSGINNYKSNRKRNYEHEDIMKIYKEEIKVVINELKKIMIYENEDFFLKEYVDNKNITIYIESIINKLKNKINNYKKKINSYEYNDILNMVISLLKKNKEICTEIKNNFDEIMIDEYQDTNGLQNDFINLISNNNLFLVGDIKQSIYKFRDADPIYFQKKYDEYDGDKGVKIDLNYNYRSREEVLQGINSIFVNVMSKNIGGSSYGENEQLNYGNLMFEQKRDNQNYNLRVLNYENEEIKEIKDKYRFEQSCFESIIIAQDIKEKIKSNYQILDKETKEFRAIKYKDILILSSRKKKFSELEKAFNHFDIPIKIQLESSFVKNHVSLFILNILNLLENKNPRYQIMAILRSFVYQLDDTSLHELLININDFEDLRETKLVDLYQKIELIKKSFSDCNIEELLNLIIKTFNINKQITTLDNIKIAKNDLLKLLKLFKTFNGLNYTINDIIIYFNYLIDNDKDVEIEIAENIDIDAVQAMTIHKSKGLEYPILYLFDLSSKFKNTKTRDVYDSNFGIIISNNIKNKETKFIESHTNYLEIILKEEKHKKMISEQIRLLYVATTRAVEEINIILENKKKENVFINENIILKQNSFNGLIGLTMLDELGFYHSTKQVEEKIIENIIFNNNKKKVKKIINNEEMQHKELSYIKSQKGHRRASRNDVEILDEITMKNIKKGDLLHRKLQVVDFNNMNQYIEDHDIGRYITNMKNIELFKNVVKYYTEYDFFDAENNIVGIIDLIIEKEDCFLIIDYKLKEINKIEYFEQLNVYYNYLSKIVKKEIKMFLYSLEDNEILKVEKT